MTFFEEFFPGGIFVINMKRRPDRLERFASEMKRIGVTSWKRFEAYDAGPGDGNRGCTGSHRLLLDQIARSGKTSFVFEDDAVVRDGFHDTFHEHVRQPLSELPSNFHVIYLGAGYGEDPQGWHSKHLIRVNGMKTTSSYGITPLAARIISDSICEGSVQAIDDYFAGFNPGHNVFVSEPRLFVQYENYSNLQERVMANHHSMLDKGHVERLGKYNP